MNLPQLAIVVRDANAPELGPVFASAAVAGTRMVATRMMAFGGRTFAIEYLLQADTDARIWQRALAVASIAAILLLAALALALRLQVGADRLAAALAARAEAEQRHRVVIAELNHRIGNIFAVTQAVVSQALKHDSETRSLLTSRLHAMAQATGLLGDMEWKGAALDDLVSRMGLPFADRVLAQGPRLVVAPGAAQSLVLILHELWTNAAKHGALSTPTGRVLLSWEINEGFFKLEWRESGGPVLAVLPERQGFGRELIERLGPTSLGGQAILEVDEGAIRYRLQTNQDGFAGQTVSTMNTKHS
jgi:two-component sensor histidine kinase